MRAPEVKIGVVGFPLFLIWEMLQSPFYTDTFTESWRQVVYNRIHCAIGDLLILLGAFWLVALFWGRDWIAKKDIVPVFVLLAIAVTYTIVSEYRNVRLAQNWAYSEWMPTIGGIGLIPVVQWIVIPVLTLHIFRQETR